MSTAYRKARRLLLANIREVRAASRRAGASYLQGYAAQIRDLQYAGARLRAYCKPGV